MLSAQCSICTENKSPVTGRVQERVLSFSPQRHSPEEHSGPHLEHIVQIKAWINKQVTNETFTAGVASPAAVLEFFSKFCACGILIFKPYFASCVANINPQLCLACNHCKWGDALWSQGPCWLLIK